MAKLNFGDIVLLKFPFTDGKTYKRRPALIINDLDEDVIVCMITSQIYETKNDIYIDDWEKSGLKLPSVIRVHKIATLEKNMVEIIIGQVDNSIREKIRMIISKLTD